MLRTHVLNIARVLCDDIQQRFIKGFQSKKSKVRYG